MQLNQMPQSRREIARGSQLHGVNRVYDGIEPINGPMDKAANILCRTASVYISVCLPAVDSRLAGPLYYAAQQNENVSKRRRTKPCRMPYRSSCAIKLQETRRGTLGPRSRTSRKMIPNVAEIASRAPISRGGLLLSASINTSLASACNKSVSIYSRLVGLVDKVNASEKRCDPARLRGCSPPPPPRLEIGRASSFEHCERCDPIGNRSTNDFSSALCQDRGFFAEG
jgi:hypothetical protein